MNNDQFLKIIKKTRDRKIRNVVCNLIIFFFSISILTGFTTQNLIVFGQNNMTGSSAADDVEVIQSFQSEIQKESNNNQDSMKLTSDNTTASSNSVTDGLANNDDDGDNNQEQDINNDSVSSMTVNPSLSKPDRDCLFDPSMPKCAQDENGHCPSGFAMNEDGQCFPRGGCPDGYYRADDDETGRCIPNSEGCPSDMIFRPDHKSCGYKDDVCGQYVELKACQTNDEGNEQSKKAAAFDSGYTHGCSDAKIPIDSQRYLSQPGKGPSYHTSDFMDGYYQGFDYCSATANSNNIPYDSGYQHGCNDAKINDVSKRYINQLGTGPAYHTNEFMRGYDDGFDVCSNGSSSSDGSSTIAKGTFKITVEVTNNSPNDLTGDITVSVDHQPQKIVKDAYGLYIPGKGNVISKTFTFKASDVPVGTDFEVNLNYWDGNNNNNQKKFGENSPQMKTEVAQFVIPYS